MRDDFAFKIGDLTLIYSEDIRYGGSYSDLICDDYSHTQRILTTCSNKYALPNFKRECENDGDMIFLVIDDGEEDTLDLMCSFIDIVINNIPDNIICILISTRARLILSYMSTCPVCKLVCIGSKKFLSDEIPNSIASELLDDPNMIYAIHEHQHELVIHPLDIS